jgi:hypothetical protein
VTLRATETFSKLYEKGFWSASQIKIKDKLGNERWVKVGEYSWRLYLNNAHGTAWPPRYLKNTLKLEKSEEFDPTGAQLTCFTGAKSTQTDAFGGRPRRTAEAVSRDHGDCSIPTDGRACQGGGSGVDAARGEAVLDASCVEGDWPLRVQLPYIPGGGNMRQGPQFVAPAHAQ